MAPDPITATAVGLAVGKHSKEIAERGMVEVSRKVRQVYDGMVGSFSIESQEVTIRCPEQLEVVSIAFKSKPGVIGQKVKFTGGRPRRVRVRPLMGLAEYSPEATALTENGFEIRTGELRGDGLFLLDVEYKLDSPGFVDALVDRNAPRETPKGNQSEYWLQAQLKHPKALRGDYGRFDLRDVDFEVNVGVAEHIKTVVPGTLVRELETAVALLKETDVHKKAALARAHTVAMRQRGKGTTAELLGNLQAAFLPDSFKNYVDVKQDFRYGDCEPGQSLYDTLPLPTWPRSMKVTSRADLSLDTPAAHGTLVYRKDDFVARVEELLESRSKRRNSTEHSP